MKAFLMYKDQDFDLQQPLPSNEAALTEDLELNTLFYAMAQGDKFLFDVAKKAILSGLYDLETIGYRQDILKDCMKNSTVIREIYHIPIEAIENKQKHWLGIFSSYPAGILSSSLELLEMFVELLKKLRRIADEHSGEFDSEGFTRFFTMIQQELDDEFFAIVAEHLKELKFSGGVLISADLGKGNEGTNYILRKPHPKDKNWIKRIMGNKPEVYSYSLHPRDDAGAQALGGLRDRGVNLVANAVAQSTDHIDSFLKMLRVELGFYIGCLNLHELLTQMEEPVAFPSLVPQNERSHTFTGLYDVCLALTMKQKVVGNDVSADNKDLVIITGANQGGKSTFLRSIGLAQMMMQCGMYVAAESFSANVSSGLFTHYKREEDPSMTSGKFDEELGRMSEIVDRITSNSMVLFNESFAATNEVEGSEIARQITLALLEKQIKVFFVTHLYEFAHEFYDRHMDNAIFLRAERKTGGERTFKVIEGEPLQTSFGKDVYRKIFREGKHQNYEELTIDAQNQ